MLYYQNHLCISYKELVDKTAEPNQVGSGVITQNDYRNYKNRNKLIALQNGCRGKEALYSLDLAPADLVNKVKRVYGTDISDIAKRSPLANLYQLDIKAQDYFFTYRKPDGSLLNAEKQRTYTADASALNAVIILLQQNRQSRNSKAGKQPSANIYNDVIIPALQAYKGQWGHKLPLTARSLKERIKGYQESGYAALISGKEGNNNAAKVAEPEHHSMLRRLLSHANNFDYAQVAMMYNQIASANGWKKVTRRTVENFADKNRIYTEGGRKGEVQFDNVLSMQHKRKKPSYPMLMWTVDGWDVELTYQQTQTNKNGHSVTTYHNRLTAVIVLDPCCNYPIGYAIGTHETPALVRQAVRNAINHTAEIFGGVRYRPNQLQSDRYGNGALSPFFEGVTPRYTPAKAKNAKSKIIENWFGMKMNKEHCQYMNNWSGFGATSRPDNQPNAEWKNKIRHSFPDKIGCEKQIHEIIDKLRTASIEQFKERWQSLPETYKLPWTTEQYLYYAGETKERTTKLRGEGIVFDINRTEYSFDSYDTSFRNHAHIDWLIRYDPSDMSNVLASNTDGSIRFILEEKYIQPMALLDRVEGDAV